MKIKPIKMPEELKAILSNKNKTKLLKTIAIKKYTGICCMCDEIATKMVCYDLGDTELIEKYCDKHGPG